MMRGWQEISEFVVKHDYCCGCGVCVIVCPCKAIRLVLNEEGFYESTIDETICTKCGRCERVCPGIEGISVPSVPLSCLAAYSHDERTRLSCSSGGIAHELAVAFLGHGYLSCGVRYDAEMARAEHFLASNPEEYDAARGSKYLQSYTADAFSRFGNGGRYIVFGTPCQIYGLRQYITLHKMEEHFVLVDFFCHGTPSYHLWKSYRAYLNVKHGLGRPTTVRFRDKSTKLGWHDFGMRITDGEREHVSSLSDGDLFYNMFLANVCLNRPCYLHCSFRASKSAADIRLGDFWGDLFQADRKGVSAVLVMTDKGKVAMNLLAKTCSITCVTAESVLIGQIDGGIPIPSVRGRTIGELRSGVSLDMIHTHVRLYFRLRSVKSKLRILMGNINARVRRFLSADWRKS